MQSSHFLLFSFSKHSQSNPLPIPFFQLLPYHNLVLLCTTTSSSYYLYKEINFSLVTLLPSMFPYNCSHMLVTCSKHQEIMSINLKATFTKTQSHISCLNLSILGQYNFTTHLMKHNT